MEFRHVLSIGAACQAAFQIHRRFGKAGAHYFDWLITNHNGTITALRDDLDNLFRFEDFKPYPPEGKGVMNTHSGFLYFHQFGHDGDIVSEDQLAERYPGERDKFDYLRQRWLATVQEGPILFVRRDHATNASVEEMWATLNSCYPDLEKRLLVILFPEDECTVSIDGVCVTSAPPGNDWTGDNESWDAAFDKALATFGASEMVV